MDSVIKCDNSCNATNVRVLISINLLPSFVVFKQKAIALEDLRSLTESVNSAKEGV